MEYEFCEIGKGPLEVELLWGIERLGAIWHLRHFFSPALNSIHCLSHQLRTCYNTFIIPQACFGVDTRGL